MYLGFWEKNNRRALSLKQGEAFDVNHFKYRSFHFPVFDEKKETKNQLKMLRQLIVCQSLNTALVHPIKVNGDYPEEIYRAMVSGGIPLAIENMDSNKDSGFDIEELKSLVKSIGLGFVLDVQHAYEHDPKMEYAEDLFDAIKGSLMHLHLSGQKKGSIHSLVSESENAEKIIDFTKIVLEKKRLPLILEGIYQNTKGLKKEIEFLKKELSS
jgi:hypothetical protein